MRPLMTLATALALAASAPALAAAQNNSDMSQNQQNGQYDWNGEQNAHFANRQMHDNGQDWSDNGEDWSNSANRNGASNDQYGQTYQNWKDRSDGSWANGGPYGMNHGTPHFDSNSGSGDSQADGYYEARDGMAYNSGFTAGYARGYERGYDRGHDVGLRQGSRVERNQGQSVDFGQVPQRIRQKLENEGFSDVQIAPGSLVVRATDSEGSRVLMLIGPHSMTMIRSMSSTDQSETPPDVLGSSNPAAKSTAPEAGKAGSSDNTPQQSQTGSPGENTNGSAKSGDTGSAGDSGSSK